VAWAAQNLELAGLQSVRTFDLQAARPANLKTTCPQHGSQPCNCQMVVLLVYQADDPPATLVIHGSETNSWLYLINTPRQPVANNLEKYIREALAG
jgi:hypothetical protein